MPSWFMKYSAVHILMLVFEKKLMATQEFHVVSDLALWGD